MTDPAAQIEETSPRDAVHLLEAHHALMQSLFSPESNNFLELQELLQPEIHFFGAYLSDQMVGCGALMETPGYGEIKSMYVAEEARGKGVASAILGRLISEAKRLGISLLRLETGDTLKAAHRLYEKHGFTFRGPFGEYPDLPESLFMEKRLF